MIRKYNLMVFVLSMGLSVCSQGLPGGYVIEKIVSQLNPVAFTQDHFGRIWVAEKDGRVLIFEHDGTPLPVPFVTLEVDDFNERGLMGIVLHPDFASNGFVYLYYTLANTKTNRVIRLTASGDTALPGSMLTIIDLEPLTGSIHNGGAMIFDESHYLYIATGDGGNSPDAQRLNHLHGKILRVHDDGSIPQDNPFYQSQEGKYRSIYAYGLRNPFSMVLDKDNNRILVGDVGQGDYEEVDVIVAGANYGWPVVEGYATVPHGLTDYMDPYFAYDHDHGCAIIGVSYNERANTLFGEPYRGGIFYADYCEGYIAYLPDNGVIESQYFGELPERPLNIAFDDEGSMLLLTRQGIGGGSTSDNTATKDGAIWRISYTGSGAPFIYEQSEPVVAAKGDTVSVYIGALGAGDLQFTWYKDDVIESQQAGPIYQILDIDTTWNSSMLYAIVTNDQGSDTSRIFDIKVLDKGRPQPIILQPYDDYRYKAGDTIYYTGRAIDGGALMPEDRLSWTILQHHGNHTHPILEDVCCTAGGYLTIPFVGETSADVYLEMILKATDTYGLSGSYAIDILPDQSQICFDGPVGASVNVDGTLYELPICIPGTKRILRTIEVPLYQVTNDQYLVFRSWGDGDTLASRVANMGEDTLHYQLNFDTYQLGKGTGLLGYYFNDPEFDLDGEPAYVRHDSLISFNWGNGSPHSSVDKDKFTVSWTGYIQSLVAGEYTFSVFSDDGCRLYINDSLIIDEWHNQSARENQGMIHLEKEKRYKIRLDYMELAGGALVELKWQAARMPKGLVPTSQLYRAAPPSVIKGEAFLDLNLNNFRDIGDPPLIDLPIILYNQDHRIVKITHSDSFGAYSLHGLDSGYYVMHFNADIIDKSYTGIHALDSEGYTPTFYLRPDQEKFVLAPFQLVSASEDELWHEGVTIYPNPFTDHLMIVSDISLESIHIYDMSQRVVYATEGDEHYLVPRLVPGVYMIRIVTARGICWKKIICVS